MRVEKKIITTASSRIPQASVPEDEAPLRRRRSSNAGVTKAFWRKPKLPTLRRNPSLRAGGGFIVTLVFFFGLCGFFYFIDAEKPQKLKNLWLRHPQLDRLYRWTKFSDFFDPSWFFYKSQLLSYELRIDNQELDKIKKSLPPAYSLNFYLQKDYYWAPAEFIYKDKKYSVKVRIRGDLYPHWSGEKKSYRLEFTDTFQDFPELNFIIPEDRGFFAENLANFRAEKMGLIYLQSWFGVLKINGKNQGVYLIQEHWNKEFLERNQKNGVGALYGEQNLEEGFYWPQLFSGIMAWKKYNPVKGEKENYYDLDYLLKLIDKKTSDEEFKEKIFAIFDEENFLAWQAHSMLSSSYHQDWGHNLRLYFNQEKGKFELIPFDLEPHFDYQKTGDFYPAPLGDSECRNATVTNSWCGVYPIDLDYNPLVTRVLLIPQFRLERDRVLYKYVQEEENLKEDLGYWDDLFTQLRPEIFKDRLKTFSNRFFLNQTEKNREHFKNHFSNIKRLLTHNDLKIAASSIGKDKIKLEFTNSAPSPAFVEEVVFYDKEGEELFKKEIKLEVESNREVEPRKEGELYGLIKVVPKTEEISLEIEPKTIAEIDFSRTKVKAVNLVSEKEIEEIEFLISN